MFDGFEKAKDETARKRWFASSGVSLAIYAVIGVIVVVVARHTMQRATAEPEVDVTFRAPPEPAMPEPEKAAPPPPPPPSPGPKRKKPGKPAPANVDDIPEDRPAEGEPTGRHDGAEPEDYGDGDGGGEAPPAPPPPPPPPPPKVVKDPDPIDEVDPSVKPAKALDSNALPMYPAAARKKGTEAIVDLKIEISPRGDVVKVVVLRGQEPFASAAVAAVKTWRYRPATVDGRPVAVFRKIRIPFRLQS